ncbi:hypothetical protein HT031_003821 [Scenedesmus sp. PABB004]|nr:hypothetical protein HT031_003819 [Scenedesmus sp. PABB004]KAF8062982.1 hypothetical protein HT031_003821 [Scenedesmus sp. PABB004]
MARGPRAIAAAILLALAHGALCQAAGPAKAGTDGDRKAAAAASSSSGRPGAAAGPGAAPGASAAPLHAGDADVKRLKKAVRGAVLLPGEAAFDAARKYVEPINTYYNAARPPPALIVRAESEGDVQAAVNFARARGLPLCARAGGHDSGGYSRSRLLLVRRRGRERP